MDYKLIYKPSTILEAIYYIRSHNANHKCNQCVHFLTRDRLWWCSVDVSRVPLLPIANRLSHGNKNNGRLLEKPITLERKGIFTIATFK